MPINNPRLALSSLPPPCSLTRHDDDHDGVYVPKTLSYSEIFELRRGGPLSSSSGAKPLLEDNRVSSIHVVCCKEKPPDKDPKDFYIRTLTTVLGNEEAAKKAFIVENGYCGFSATNLTPEQVDQISKHPSIFHVYKNDRTYDLRRWHRFQ